MDGLRKKDGFGQVIFSHRMMKVNKGNSNASRAVLITDSLIYKLDPGKNSKYKAMGKGIPILNVSGYKLKVNFGSILDHPIMQLSGVTGEIRSMKST